MTILRPLPVLLLATSLALAAVAEAQDQHPFMKGELEGTLPLVKVAK